jgi:hypothetical protein
MSLDIIVYIYYMCTIYIIALLELLSIDIVVYNIYRYLSRLMKCGISLVKMLFKLFNINYANSSNST